MADGASVRGATTAAIAANNATNCSWVVMTEVFGEANNLTAEVPVCLSDMLVYSDGMWAVAGVFCWAAIAVACWNMYRHFDNYAEPQFQVYVVRIIFIIPVYALCSWLSLRFYDAQLYIATFRDCFEAYIIWCFLRLIMEWMGGQAECVAKLETRQRMRHPWPFGRCCRRIILNATFIRRCKQGTLQFVILKPVMAVVSIVMLGVDEYDNPVYQWVLGVLYNISYTWALYVLYLLYVATKSFLKAFDPVKKFLAVKVVIFMTYYQALAFYLLPLGEAEAEGWSNALLCLEMFVFSILHFVAFKPPPKAGVGAGGSGRGGLSIGARAEQELAARAAEAGLTPDEMRDVEARRTLKNLQGVFSMTDVVRDTIHNFDPKYDHYVAQRSAAMDADGNMILEAPEQMEMAVGGGDSNESDANDSVGGGAASGGGGDTIELAEDSQDDDDDEARTRRRQRRQRRLQDQGRGGEGKQDDAAADDDEDPAAVERAWAEQEARLAAAIAADGGGGGGRTAIAASTLKQQAMRLPLHRRRKGGYTRTIPTTYAEDDDDDPDHDNRGDGDDGVGRSARERPFRDDAGSSSSSDDDHPHLRGGGGAVTSSKNRNGRSSQSNARPSGAVAPAALEVLEDVLMAATDLPPPAARANKYTKKKKAQNKAVTSAAVVVGAAPERSSTDGGGGGGGRFVGASARTRPVALGGGGGSSDDDDDDDDDDDGFDLGLNVDGLSEDEPSSDELDLGLAGGSGSGSGGDGSAGEM